MALLLMNLIRTSILTTGIFLSIAHGKPLKDSTSIQLVLRSEWSARPPAKPASPLQILPPPYVIISHTTTAPCHSLDQCKSVVRSIQNHHIGVNGWDEIGYNFLIGGDGKVYEGRGWDVQGAHTKNYNNKSIGLSFIGNFNTQQPTDPQLEAAKNLLEYGWKNGKISNDYKLLGHRQLSSTTSPGDVLYNIIKTWDHWSSSP